MKRVLLLLAAILFTSNFIVAQLNQKGGVPFGLTNPEVIEGIEKPNVFPNKTPDEFLAEDIKNQGEIGVPMRIGVSVPLGVNVISDENYVQLDGKTHIWRYAVKASHAKSLSLVFQSLDLPQNAKLYVYSLDGEYILGYFDEESNSYGKPFVSQFIPTDEIVVEVQYLANDKSTFGSKLIISEVAYAYRNVYGAKDVGSSDACQVNIECPEGDDWRKEQRGVARILFREGTGWYYCTGSLINNTSQDGTSYFLTADHCGGTASAADRDVWQFVFRFERPDCSNSWGPVNSSHITGCSLIARGELAGGSDFQLVELNATVPRSLRPYFNGWDRSTWASTSGVGIHHPSGDVKKISTYTTSLQTSTPNIAGDLMASGSAWRVVWSATETNHGTTEQGSSGSPIFNSDKRIIGTLSGGSSACDNPTFPDYYGKFNYHWSSNGSTDASKLEPWLDPTGTNASSLDGLDPLTPQSLEYNINGAQVQLSWEAPMISSGLSGYVIFEDDTEIATVGSSTTSYNRNHTVADDYEYYVKATYASPSYTSEPSNTVLASVSLSGYTVTFDVRNSSNSTISDATVTFNGIAESPGVYVFSDVANGTYSYSVERDGYNAFNGSLTVNNANVNQPITLVLVGVDNNTYGNFSLYPNPFKGFVEIVSSNPISRVEIYNSIGQVVHSKAYSNKEVEIDTKKLFKGIYLVRIEFLDGTSVVRRVVKE